MKTEFNFK